jgi:hypothetical protein
MGGTGTAASTAPLLAASGAASLLAPLLHAPAGSAQLSWTAPPAGSAGTGPSKQRFPGTGPAAGPAQEEES